MTSFKKEIHVHTNDPSLNCKTWFNKITKKTSSDNYNPKRAILSRKKPSGGLLKILCFAHHYTSLHNHVGSYELDYD